MPSYFNFLPNELVLEILKKLESEDLHNFVRAYPVYRPFRTLILKGPTNDKCFVCNVVDSKEIVVDPKCYVCDRPVSFLDMLFLCVLLSLVMIELYAIYFVIVCYV